MRGEKNLGKMLSVQEKNLRKSVKREFGKCNDLTKSNRVKGRQEKQDKSLKY